MIIRPETVSIDDWRRDAVHTGVIFHHFFTIEPITKIVRVSRCREGGYIWITDSGTPEPKFNLQTGETDWSQFFPHYIACVEQRMDHHHLTVPPGVGAFSGGFRDDRGGSWWVFPVVEPDALPARARDAERPAEARRYPEQAHPQKRSEQPRTAGIDFLDSDD